ncbi:MAG TPA: LacI family DNA-binding transcriptional regulator [Acidimicrobiales bacterium]|nr:LacI family DNA-binding transcriptional regulator [Acidimicrobiales bacterium]
MTTAGEHETARPALQAHRGRPAQRPTIEDVARLAGVSRGTVSRVLNGGQHVRPQVVTLVNAAMRELGYSVNQAARNLAGGRTGTVAFVISEHQDHLFQDPNYILFARTFGRELRSAGRHLLVTTAQDREEELSIGEYLTAGHVDGVLLGLPHLDEPLLARLAKSQVPVVVVGRPMEYEEELSWLAVDDESAACQVVNYLTGRGHSVIATVTGPLNTSGGRARHLGYRRALGDSYDESLVAEADWSLQSGRAGAERLLARHPDIDALFAASDLMALGAMAALRQAGRRVPEDVAVAGFDDSEIAVTAEPPLTTVHHPLEEIALGALRILDDLIEGRASEPRHVLFPTTFVQRESA